MELELVARQRNEETAGVTVYQASINKRGQVSMEWSDSCMRRFGFFTDERIWGKPPRQLFGAAYGDWHKNARQVILTGEPCAWDHHLGQEGQLLVRHRLARLDRDKVFGVMELRGQASPAKPACPAPEGGGKTEPVPADSAADATADSVKDHFLAAFSHEIQTPMNAILGLSRKALKTELTGQQQKYIGDINAAAQYLMNMLKSLLRYFKVEADKVELESIPVNIPEIFAMQKSLFGTSAQEKGLDLFFNIDRGIPEVMYGDHLRISEVLANLLSNSLKFTHHGGVYVRCEVAGQDESGILLRFEVRDTGIGMTAEQQKRVFEAFYQADASVNRLYGGTGLGLFIARGLVEKMGGTITIAGGRGRGTRIAFTCRMALGPSAREEENAHGPPRFSGQTILVVDDAPLNQEVLKDLLEELNLTVVIANNGQEALDLLESRGEDVCFSLVFMDLHMPVLDGFQTAVQMRQTPGLETVPVIAVSASCAGQEREPSLAAGMDEYLGKPVDIASLHRLLRRYLKEESRSSQSLG